MNDPKCDCCGDPLTDPKAGLCAPCDREVARLTPPPTTAELAGRAMVDAARRDGLNADFIASYCVPPAQTGVWNTTKPAQPARGATFESKPAVETVAPGTSQGVATGAVATNQANDPVNRPAYYTAGAVEAIDAIRAAVVGRPAFEAFLMGQCVKYLWRLGKKGPALEDARKARWYLERLIVELGGVP
jgi:hypothetical protein